MEMQLKEAHLLNIMEGLACVLDAMSSWTVCECY